MTHRWWLTQGQSCQSEAELELKTSDLLATSLLLFPLSTSLLYTYRPWGIKAPTNSSVLKQPWKAPQSPGLSITCWQCQQKRPEIRPLVITWFLRESFGLLIGFAGLEMYGHRLFLCQEEVWWDQAQARRFHGLKAYSTRIIAPLTFPAYLLPPLAIAKEMKSPLDTWLCDFLIPMSVQHWRIQGEAKTREPTEAAALRRAVKGCCCGFAGWKIETDTLLLLSALHGSWAISGFNYSPDLLG